MASTKYSPKPMTAAARARANSAAAAKAVAPKKLTPVKGLKRIKSKEELKGPIKIDTNPKPVVVKPIPVKSRGGIRGGGMSFGGGAGLRGNVNK